MQNKQNINIINKFDIDENNDNNNKIIGSFLYVVLYDVFINDNNENIKVFCLENNEDIILSFNNDIDDNKINNEFIRLVLYDVSNGMNENIKHYIKNKFHLLIDGINDKNELDEINKILLLMVRTKKQNTNNETNDKQNLKNFTSNLTNKINNTINDINETPNKQNLNMIELHNELNLNNDINDKQIKKQNIKKIIAEKYPRNKPNNDVYRGKNVYFKTANRQTPLNTDNLTITLQYKDINKTNSLSNCSKIE